ncbi:hypothetical protein G9A89_001146 [Geosiphon pyriformis]|nr:hypothetical protein G9A89_001146 [Geosiphon pyriformis]
MNFPSQKSTSSSLSTFHGFPKVSRPLRALIEFVIRTTIDPDTLSKINRQLTKPLHLLIEPRSVKRPNIIPRPQNLFVLYRCDMQEVFLRENGESTIGNQLKEVSKWASKKWKEEPEEIRDLYQEMAKCAKKVHLMAYPNYEYKPRRKRVPFKEFYKNHQIHVHGKQKLSTILPANIITQRIFSPIAISQTN